jgi:DNA-directed RNA polymerase subunit beta
MHEMADTRPIAARERVNFSKIRTAIQIPNLIEVQKNSYERFLQMNMLPEEREDTGLQAVFNSVFPISDFRGVSTLEYISYSIGNWECKCGNLKGLDKLRSTCKSCGASIAVNPFSAEPTVMCSKCGTQNKNQVTFCNKCGDPVQLNLKYDVAECQERGMTYAAPLKVVIRLTIFDKDPETGAKTIRDIKEQEVYFGEIPLMTDNGTFIINGTERVIVSQLHRSPGVFFESTPAKSYFLGKIIPYRGSWVEFEYETAKNILYVRIDRKRKFLATIFLRALGLKTDEEIIRAFYKTDRITIEGKKLYWTVSDNIQGMKVSKDILHPKTKEVLLHGGKKITSSVFSHIKQAKVEKFEVSTEDLEGAFAAADVVDTNTGEVIVETNNELSQAQIRSIVDAGVPELPVFFPSATILAWSSARLCARTLSRPRRKL